MRKRGSVAGSNRSPGICASPLGRVFGTMAAAALRGGTPAMKLLLRFLGFLFAAGTIVFVAGLCAVAGLLWHFSKACRTTLNFRITSRR